MVAIFIKAAASLATGLLGVASLRNMAETYYICSSSTIGTTTGVATPSNNVNSNSILEEYISMNENINECNVAIPQHKTDRDVIHDLKQMPRRDLIRLFLHCDVPNDLSEVCGDWDGILLNNNYILTSVSNFITNQLFGINYSGGWFGKTFEINKNTASTGIGENRFLSQTDGDSNKNIQNAHKFEYYKSKSKLKGNGILLDYSRHQNMLSPWKTMKDEIRVLRRSDINGKNDITILLGVGSMAWSGGFLNCQPFCLICSKEK